MVRMPKIPKVREAVTLTLGVGRVMSGYVFIDATSRIQDLLNSELRYFAFVDDKEQIHLINKEWVKLAQPFDG
jgi:hypothetical protein